MSERSQIISMLRDLARRIGPARLPESIREDIEELANLLASWERARGQPTRKSNEELASSPDRFTPTEE